ncbi:hypothetical protein PSPO01_05911 [Paraphaeosphaeria sporulosa]
MTSATQTGRPGERVRSRETAATAVAIAAQAAVAEASGLCRAWLITSVLQFTRLCLPEQNHGAVLPKRLRVPPPPRIVAPGLLRFTHSKAAWILHQAATSPVREAWPNPLVLPTQTVHNNQQGKCALSGGNAKV